MLNQPMKTKLLFTLLASASTLVCAQATGGTSVTIYGLLDGGVTHTTGLRGGSVGVIAARLDETRALEDAGLRVSLITSGARKADGASCTPMGDDEFAVLQADVSGLAEEFFALVSAHRPRTRSPPV